MWRLLLGTMGVKSLVQGLNAAATAGFEPRTVWSVWSEVRRRNRIGHCASGYSPVFSQPNVRKSILRYQNMTSLRDMMSYHEQMYTRCVVLVDHHKNCKKGKRTLTDCLGLCQWLIDSDESCFHRQRARRNALPLLHNLNIGVIGLLHDD